MCKPFRRFYNKAEGLIIEYNEELRAWKNQTEQKKENRWNSRKKRVPFWIACSIPLPVSFPACFLNLTNQKILRLVLSWSYIPSDGI